MLLENQPFSPLKTKVAINLLIQTNYNLSLTKIGHFTPKPIHLLGIEEKPPLCRIGSFDIRKCTCCLFFRHPDIHDILAQLTNAEQNDQDWLQTKSAIWSIANICISHEGVSFIDREGGIDVLIRITETSPVLSLKATAFYALSLVATTR